MSRYKLMLLLPLAALSAMAGAAQDAPAQQGMVVVRDADTGKLRTPTADEVRALQSSAPAAAASAKAAAAAPPAMVVGPGGRRSVKLGESHLLYSVATRDANGKLSEQCVKGEHAANSALAAPATATKPEEHHHASN